MNNTCHQPARRFTDGLALGKGIAVLDRHVPSVVGMAYSPWQFWDGRADSLWAQALGPMEHPKEMGLARTELVRRAETHYGAELRRLFGSYPVLDNPARFPPSAAPREDDEAARLAWEAMATEDRDLVNRSFAQLGKAIAAYERKLLPGPSPFDAYAAALAEGDEAAAKEALSPAAQEGLRLFIGKASCINCHNGPRLTNDEFHNIGLPLPSGGRGGVAALKPAMDLGRELGSCACWPIPSTAWGLTATRTGRRTAPSCATSRAWATPCRRPSRSRRCAVSAEPPPTCTMGASRTCGRWWSTTTRRRRPSSAIPTSSPFCSRSASRSS